MVKPYPFQEEAIQLGLMRPLLLADECGLGKTLVAIEIARRRMDHLGGQTLIVAPKATRVQWVDQIHEQDTRPVFVVDTRTPIAPYPASCYYVTHYEALWRGTLTDLARRTWTTVVADEAHRISNRNARRTKALKAIPAHRRIALTGTPIEKSPANLWSILNWLYPHFFSSYWKFCERYVEFEQVYRGKEVYKRIVGGKNYADLVSQLRYFTLQRTKSIVAPQLPTKIEAVVRVEMSDAQAELYKRVETSEDIEVDMGEFDPLIIPSVLALIVRLQQISSHPQLLGYDVESGKWQWLLEYLEDNPDEPVVVFTRFRGTAEYIHTQLPNAALYVGGSAFQEVVDFCEGRKGVLVGTIAAMGEGLNLQRARTAVFYETEYSSIRMQQAIDRIHRLDIKEPKNIVYLVASKIDRIILKAFQTKMSEIDLVKEYLNERRVD